MTIKNRFMHHETERKIYELLGVKSFRRLVLLFERIKHRNDRLINKNYHLSRNDINAVKRFTGYMLFNTVCHIISLIMVIFYFLFEIGFGIGFKILDWFMCILSVLNIYCIMLQRYTYIKVMPLINAHAKKRENMIRKAMTQLSGNLMDYDKNELQNEYNLITKIHDSIEKGTVCILEEQDSMLLRSISKKTHDILSNLIIKKRCYVKSKPLKKLSFNIPSHPYVIHKMDFYASKLQRLFKFEGRSNVLYGFGIITDDPDSEAAYRELIINNTRDSVELVFDILFLVYNKEIVSRRSI